MRTLTSREKILLLVSVSTVFIGGGMMGASTYMRRLNVAKTSLLAAQGEVTKNKTLVNDRKSWEARSALVATTAPVLTSRNAELTKFSDEIQKSVETIGLKVDKQNFEEEKKGTGGYTEVGVKFEVSGEQKKILEWIKPFQEPGKFVAVKSLTIEPNPKSKEKEPQAICRVTLARWFPQVIRSEEKAKVSENEISDAKPLFTLEKEFGAVLESPPFTRPLNLQTSMAITGFMSYGDKNYLSVVDTGTKETYTVTESPNAQGWFLSKLNVSKDGAIEAVIKINGEDRTMRYEPSKVALPTGQEVAANGEGGERRRGGDRGGEGEGRRRRMGPTDPETMKKFQTLNPQQQEKMFKFFRENRDKMWSSSEEERNKLVKGQLDTVLSEKN